MNNIISVKEYNLDSNKQQNKHDKILRMIETTQSPKGEMGLPLALSTLPVKKDVLIPLFLRNILNEI
jgi:hypothetical protein